MSNFYHPEKPIWSLEMLPSLDSNATSVMYFLGLGSGLICHVTFLFAIQGKPSTASHAPRCLAHNILQNSVAVTVSWADSLTSAILSTLHKTDSNTVGSWY